MAANFSEWMNVANLLMCKIDSGENPYLAHHSEVTFIVADLAIDSVDMLN